MNPIQGGEDSKLVGLHSYIDDPLSPRHTLSGLLGTPLDPGVFPGLSAFFGDSPAPVTPCCDRVQTKRLG